MYRRSLHEARSAATDQAQWSRERNHPQVTSVDSAPGRAKQPPEPAFIWYSLTQSDFCPRDVKQSNFTAALLAGCNTSSDVIRITLATEVFFAQLLHAQTPAIHRLTHTLIPGFTFYHFRLDPEIYSHEFRFSCQYLLKA